MFYLKESNGRMPQYNLHFNQGLFKTRILGFLLDQSHIHSAFKQVITHSDVQDLLASIVTNSIFNSTNMFNCVTNLDILFKFLGPPQYLDHKNREQTHHTYK